MKAEETRPPAIGRIIVSVTDAVATVTIANEARRNAVSVEMWRQLADFARSTDTRHDIRVAIIRGAGRLAFSGGADITGFAEARSGSTGAARYDAYVEEACAAIEAMRCPSIALIHGACVGAGAAIATSCDMRLAATGSFFAVPAARLGLGYDPRGVKRLVRVWGASAAGEILYSAERVPAERAAAMGVVAAIASADEIDAIAFARARRIASNAPITVAAAKLAVRAAASGDPALAQAADALYAAADASADYAEGRAAFLAKREPRFEGR